MVLIVNCEFDFQKSYRTVRNGGRHTSRLWKGSSLEGMERPRRRHYLADLQRERKKR